MVMCFGCIAPFPSLSCLGAAVEVSCEGQPLEGRTEHSRDVAQICKISH